MENIIKKTQLLTEKIKKSEQSRFILLEMKKIGIDKLPYSYSALDKFIDSKTMNVHYNKHYKGYVKKLNKALSEKKYGDVELEEIIKSISRYNKTIRNNAGGAFNHALFWKMLSPKKQEPKGDVLKSIKTNFGGYQQFKKKFEELAKSSFGSGWIWLILTNQNKLKLITTPNQDNPLMNIIEGGGFPILGLDLWEHAYYLKYQNKRDEYVSNFWNCVNWEFVEELYKSKQKKKSINENINMSQNKPFEGCSSEERNAYKLIFNINKDVKWDFRKKIDEVFKKLFPDNWYEKNEYAEGDLMGIYDFRGEKGRSVLNYLNTHYACYCILVNDVNIVLRTMGKQPIQLIGKTPKEQVEENKKLLDFIDEYAERIFSENSKTLQKMYPFLNKSKSYGEQGESFAASKLKQVFGADNVKITGKLGSIVDAKSGIDCVIIKDGKEYTAQIKPFQKVEFKHGIYMFHETGGVEKYKTDYMIFQNRKDTVFVFKNIGLEIVDGMYYVPESALVVKI